MKQIFLKIKALPFICVLPLLLSSCVPLIDTPPNKFCNNPTKEVTEKGLHFSVYARDHHCLTGAILKTGSTYQFKVEDIALDWADGRGRGLDREHGLNEIGWTHKDLPWYHSGVVLANSFRRCKSANWFEIIGARLDAKGEPIHFRIGEGISSGKVFTYNGPSGTPLYVYANDLSNKYHNNYGKMMLSITKVSESTAAQTEQYLSCTK